MSVVEVDAPVEEDTCKIMRVVRTALQIYVEKTEYIMDWCARCRRRQ